MEVRTTKKGAIRKRNSNRITEAGWWPAILKLKTFGPLNSLVLSSLNRRVGQSLRSSSAHNVGDQNDQHKRDQGASDWSGREKEEAISIWRILF